MEYKSSLIILVIICNQVTISISQRSTTLKQVHMVFRHGKRTPEKFGLYPKDPYINETWYPEGNGQLTNLGKQQEYDIGRSLRKVYGNFLGDIYTNDVLEAISTDYPRTKMSLLCALAGLWPPNTEQEFVPNLPWQPIPFSYVPVPEDKLLGLPLFFCPKYEEYYRKASKSQAIQNFFEENKNKIEYINENAGLNITTMFELYVMYAVLVTEEGMGKALPDWTKEVYPQFLEEAAPKEYLVQAANNIMRRYTAGQLINKILTDIDASIKGTLEPAGRKLFLYSGHEYNVAHILIALNVFKEHIPSYSARVIFEYHKIDSSHYVKIFHYDLTLLKRQLMRIPGCATLCPLAQFKKLLKDILPNEETIC